MERPVEALTTISVAFGRARQVLRTDSGTVFADAYTTEERRARRFRIDVSVALGAGASMHQEVTVQLGVAHSTESAYVQPLTWQAGGHERLLPSFDGELDISEVRDGTALRLVGSYTVPLGVAGRFGDSVIGHRLARRSVEMLVERFGRRLEAEVERRLQTGDGAVHARYVTTGEHEHSEHYVG